LASAINLQPLIVDRSCALRTVCSRIFIDVRSGHPTLRGKQGAQLAAGSRRAGVTGSITEALTPMGVKLCR